jgi:hypothetical protein
MPTNYEVFLRPRPNWFAVSYVYRFSSPLREGSEVYDALGESIPTEAIDQRSFGPKQKGGIIVFSKTCRPSLFLSRLKSHVVAFLKSWEERWNSFSKLTRFLNRLRNRNPAHKDLWFSIGTFYDGKYSSPDPFYKGKDFSPDTQVYDETCLTVEIAGITQSVERHLFDYFSRILSIKIFAVSGRITRGSGSWPARSFSRSSRPLIDTCL